MRLNILAFAFGVLLLQMQPELPVWWHWAFAGGLLILPRLRWSGWPAKLLAIVACCAIGFAWAGWRADFRLADELPVAWEGRDIEVIGVVATLPQDFSNGTRFEFAPETTLTAAAVVPQRIMLSWYQGRRDGDSPERLVVKPGERWRFTVRLKRPHGNANPGGFDYEAWLLERNIRASGYIRADPPARLNEMVWQPAYMIERLRFKVRASFAEILPAEKYPWAGVLVALTIGDQKSIQGDLWTTFNRTGTTHLMSISGLHVTMVAALFGWLVNFVWRRVPRLALRLPAQKAGLLAACLAACIYALIAGFAVPAQRTLYMLLVAALALLSGRLVAPSRTLTLALLVALLFDPWAVLAAGFWLSFGAVGALLYVGSAQVGEGRGWRQRMRTWGLVQWAATLASLPVLLLVFQQFSLVSPLANALAIPVISFIVTPLALLGAIVPWWPILVLAHWVMDWLMLFLNWSSSWPVWQAPAPPLWAALVAALGVAICLLPRGMPGRLLGVALLMPVLFWPLEKPDEGTAWINVLDVGQGLATVVRTREHTLIYDPGPLYSAESDAGQRVVVPYLRTLGISHIDMLMVTHRDSDHSGGTASVLSALTVGELRSSVRELAGGPCFAGQRWVWDGVLFEVLHPSAEVYATPTEATSGPAVNRKSNHISCVLRVTASGRRMLLTSDIEAPDEAALLARYPGDLAADVLLVPHHGSKTSSTAAFLNAVGASTAIIPVGYRSRFGHPKAEVVARYEAMASSLWRTDRDGAVEVRLAPPGVTVKAWRHEHRRYWHGR
ncbi:MAG: DNA internalization-related competence protein ComEC/Rec2 [Azonexus sp.]|nr:DNA internalization-related competence protein ComEC/Rec2 [Azonexus sp.]MDZ4314815.1 DNA internalization-related competence protein ComEC/Rec2 [Azonexus sp.]